MPRADLARLDALIESLDVAAAVPDVHARCRQVKDVLHDFMTCGEEILAPRLLRPAPDKYARRLVHRDPAGCYSAVAMVWGRNQGTPLHDHAGVWCVECVYRGRIRVTSYRVDGDPETGPVGFEQDSTILAGVGEAGALIPPYEYHRIENPDPDPAVTLHVYGGEMTWCHIFEPDGQGRWRRERRALTYTD